MALRLNGSSSGYVELDVPAAAGSHTLTLPDGGGSSGQYLQTNGSGGLSWAGVTTGKILQVVQTYKTDVDSIASVTEADISGFSRTITPIAAGSRFLIISNLGLSNAATGGTALLNLYRGATLIGPSPGANDASLSVYTGGTNAAFSYGHNFIDTPTYTLGDTLTYKWRWYVDNAVLTCYMNRHSANASYSMTSGITVMEVAA